MRCGGVASQKLCTARSLFGGVSVLSGGKHRASTATAGLVNECFLRFLYSYSSYSDRKRRSIAFLPQPQRFPSVLLTLASLLFAIARRRLAQLTAATAATTRRFSHKCYENKCKKCHRFASDEALAA